MKYRPPAATSAVAEVASSAVDHRPASSKTNSPEPQSDLEQFNVRLPADLVTAVGEYVVRTRSSRQEVTRIALEAFLATQVKGR
jgi:hypothetical protein